MDIKSLEIQDNIEENIINKTIKENYNKINSTTNFSIENNLLINNGINIKEEVNSLYITNCNDDINKRFSYNFYEDNERDYSENNNEKNEINNITSDKLKKNIFKVIYPKKYPLFSHLEYKSYYYNNYDYNIPSKRIRCKKRLNRGRNSDHLRLKIKRNFFNNILLKILNEKLNNIGYRNKFEKFPQNLVSDMTIKNNKKIMNMTLNEIYESKNFCKSEHDMNNFEHNLKIVNCLKKDENLMMRNILNMKICDIYEEYLISDEFDNDIKLVKNKINLSDFDLERYIYLSKTFIQFCMK